MSDPDDPRRSEIAAGLDRVRRRIDVACRAVGRDPGQVSLIVVTKTRPPSDVRILAELGVSDVGENRDQEAAPKAAECADLGLSWHFVGQLQTNKARSVARYACLVHSVDRPSLVSALAAAAAAAQRRLDCLVQVCLDDSPGRAGVTPEGVAGLAADIAARPSLRLRGVMAVAPLGADPLGSFAVLPVVLATLRETHAEADIVSAGMSEDLEAALACGATHLRVGSAVLGRRPVLR